MYGHNLKHHGDGWFQGGLLQAVSRYVAARSTSVAAPSTSTAAPSSCVAAPRAALPEKKQVAVNAEIRIRSCDYTSSVAQAAIVKLIKDQGVSNHITLLHIWTLTGCDFVFPSKQANIHWF